MLPDSELRRLANEARAESGGEWRQGTVEKHNVFGGLNEPDLMTPGVGRVIFQSNRYRDCPATMAYAAAASPDRVLALLDDLDTLRAERDSHWNSFCDSEGKRVALLDEVERYRAALTDIRMVCAIGAPGTTHQSADDRLESAAQRAKFALADSRDCGHRGDELAHALDEVERLKRERDLANEAVRESNEEIDELRQALTAQCWEHADNCCASWCEHCKQGKATKAAALGSEP